MVQDRESLEGPITRLGSRLCMLLSISPLAAGIVIEEEEKGQLHPENISGDDKDRKVIGARRAALESSISFGCPNCCSYCSKSGGCEGVCFRESWRTKYGCGHQQFWKIFSSVNICRLGLVLLDAALCTLTGPDTEQK
jgi:hypothetical protein